MRGGWRPDKSPFMTAIIELSAKDGGAEYAATVLHNNAEDRQKQLEDVAANLAED